MQPNAPPGVDDRIDFNLLNIFLRASIVVQATIVILLVMSALVWLVALLKIFQVSRIRSRTLSFERAARQATTGADLYELASRGRGSSGGRVLFEIYSRAPSANLERLRAIADRAILTEGQSARAPCGFSPSSRRARRSSASSARCTASWTPSSASAPRRRRACPSSPRRSARRSSPPAIGLAAAIPAVFFYNWIDKRVGDFVAELEAAAAEWVALFAETEGGARHGRTSRSGRRSGRCPAVGRGGPWPSRRGRRAAAASARSTSRRSST